VTTDGLASGPAGANPSTAGLAILAVDDEEPALDELSYLLERSPHVRRVAVAGSATEGLRRLRDEEFDVVLLDVRMPGLDGLELAHVLNRFSTPPAVVFVTAHEDHALEAFHVGAAGYLLKPVDATRLAQVLRRISPAVSPAVGPTVGPAVDRAPDGSASHREGTARHPAPADVIAVDAGSRTLLVPRFDVLWVEAAGDYVRLHLRDGTSYLLRTPMAVLEEEWSDAFVRVHRSYLVSLRDITELGTDGGHSLVRLGDQELPVSRRHVHELRERLVRRGRPGSD
jgi:DNA-binding LytR/AlgR family response regulator